ncbi:hypothetical protein C8R42DRAFT_728941 [Lentinula raphanica]|nr:hypothetical protein C8R42DRAFT_728941 [Lentinula raphanica]
MPSIASISTPTTLVRASLYRIHLRHLTLRLRPFLLRMLLLQSLWQQRRKPHHHLLQHPLPSAATAGDDVPPRPVFKAPLLEDEDLPPRPTYTELHPEPEELDALPRLQTRKKPCK